MAVTVYTADKEFSELVKGEVEYPRLNSRKVATIASGENLVFGEVVGEINLACPTTGTAGSNTGDGTCTAVTAGALTQLGTYTLTCVAEAANAGTFTVVGPDGGSLPDATVAVAYTNAQINFTLNDGAEDYDIGDTFTVETTAGSGEIVAIEFAAVDGSQNAYGFTFAAYDATSAALDGVLFVRDTNIDVDELTWPDGTTAGQKAAALTQLDLKGIRAKEVI